MESVEKNNYSVYKHIAPNGKVYIGITSQKPKNRWKEGKGYKRHLHFYSAILKYGWDNIKHEVLYERLTKEQAEQKEIELIALYKSNNVKYGYNKAIGGGANKGYHFSEEAKEKISRANKGRHHTKEVCEMLSKRQIGEKNHFYGKSHSEETKRKISLAEKGKIVSEETKRKMSLSRKSNVNLITILRNYNKKKSIKVVKYSINGDILNIYSSLRYAAAKEHKNRDTIKRLAENGIIKNNIYWRLEKNL